VKFVFGASGTLLVFAAVFVPLVSLPDAEGGAVESQSCGDYSSGTWWLLLVLAVFSLVLVLRQRYGGLWITGGVALLAAAVLLGEAVVTVWGVTKELEGGALEGAVGVRWGWIVLFAGAGLLLASAAMQIRSWRREDTTSAWGTAAILFFVFALGYPMLYVFKEAFHVPPAVGVLGEGETLGDFAARHSVTPEKLRSLNDIAPGAEPEPGAALTLESGGLGLRNFWTFLADPASRGWIANSLALGFFVTLITFAIALPLAFFVVRREFPGKAMLSALVLVPLVLPPFVGAIGIQRMLARFGSLNLLLMGSGITSGPIDFLGAGRFWGVVIVEALHLYPIMYLNLAAAMANVDPALEEAAESLGDSGLRRFLRVTFPLMLPGVFAGCAIVFVWAFTDLGTPLVFQYQNVVAKRIFDKTQSVNVDPQGYVLVIVVLAITAGLFALGRYLARRRPVESATKGASAAPTVYASTGEKRLAYVLFGGITAVALAPHAGVVLEALAGEWFMTVLPTKFTLSRLTGALTHEVAIVSMRNSLLLSLGSTAVALGLGVVLSAFIVRSRSRLVSAADTVVMLPLAIPGVVLAFGYVGAYSGSFSWLNPRENPVILLVASYAVRRLPFVVRALVAGLEQTPRALEEASLSLGATPRQTLRRVTLPLISAQLVAGAILAFSFAMLEVSDSLILAMREKFFPLTKGIYSLSLRPGDGLGIACALGLFGMVLLGGSLFAASRLLGKRLGTVFRAG
jgi:iron(III) transport system permease protein